VAVWPVPQPADWKVNVRDHFNRFKALLSQLQEDRVAHGRDISLPGFRAIAVYRLGTWIQTLPTPARWILFPLYRTAYRWVRNHYGILLYYTARVGRRVVFANQGNISLHKQAVIGDDCIIRQNITIGGVTNTRNESPELGCGVEVGAGAVIIGKISIGDRARIGPNTVITQSLPTGSIAVLEPPRVILREQRPASALTEGVRPLASAADGNRPPNGVCS
jgi:serine O-acetyltransferase